MPEEYLTLEEAAALAGVGRGFAYERVLDGRWPSTRGPRLVYRIPREEFVLALARERAADVVTMESVVRELGDVIGVIEQIPLRDGEAWTKAQGRLRGLRARAVQLAEHGQRAAIRRALAKGQADDKIDHPADRVA